MIVLDTHIWIWLVNGNFDNISEGWIEQIEANDFIAVSSISCFEVALALQKGRLRLPCPIQEWFDKSLSTAGINIAPLTPDISRLAVDLSAVHKDPFDRIIIATAISHGAKPASVDQLFLKYPELKGYLMTLSR
ncbi:MAG: PIN domain-containing protein [Cyanobacteria bacterium P01_A01_bin.116]